MDLIDDECVVGGNEIVLKPAPGDAGGNDHDVPRGRLGSRLPLAVHHPDAEPGVEDGLRDRADGQCLTRSGTGDDAEAGAGRGESSDVIPVTSLQQRLDVEPTRQLYRLARRARRGNDDDAPGWGLGPAKRIAIRRQIVVADARADAHRRPTAKSLLSSPLTHELEDLAGLGVTADRLFRVDQIPVDGHFENPA